MEIETVNHLQVNRLIEIALYQQPEDQPCIFPH